MESSNLSRSTMNYKIELPKQPMPQHKLPDPNKYPINTILTCPCGRQWRAQHYRNPALAEHWWKPKIKNFFKNRSCEGVLP